GGYYLIQENSNAAVGLPLPTPDVAPAQPAIAMAAANGKVALVASTTPLSGSCPLAGVADFVGYGTANCSEGGTAAPTISATLADFRGAAASPACQDNNTNSADFAAALPAARNSAFTPTNTCSCP